MKSIRSTSGLTQRYYLVILAIQVKGSRSLLQTGVSSFSDLSDFAQGHYVPTAYSSADTAQEVLMLSNQVNNRDGSKDQVSLVKLNINGQSRFHQK